MLISIILPSYLEDFTGAAKERSAKFRRALSQLQYQVYEDWECVVISDGCEKTIEICGEFQLTDPRYKCLSISKQRQWSGIPRNIGLDNATGDIICYLDSDDYFGFNHLQNINNNFDLNRFDWCFFDDMIPASDIFLKRTCVPVIGRCGTSNIAHKPLPIRWPNRNEYGRDDWNFIKELKRYKMQIIKGGEYCVCHLPKKYDV